MSWHQIGEDCGFALGSFHMLAEMLHKLAGKDGRLVDFHFVMQEPVRSKKFNLRGTRDEPT